MIDTTASKLHSVSINDILISKNRQRKEFKPEDIVSLAGSISQWGLLCPVIVRIKDSQIFLLAGERRLRAMQYLWDIFNESVKCGEFSFSKNQVPCLYLSDLSETDAYEVELEENIRRVDLSWQERAAATENLLKLRTLQAQKSGISPPTYHSITAEIKGPGSTSSNIVRQEILVAQNLHKPEVAKASSVKEAFKFLKREEQLAQNARLAAQVGATFTSSLHQLFHGDCLELLKDLPNESIDVILTDPPYGIDADSFGDSGGAGGSKGEHFYDDSWTTWNKLMQVCAQEFFRVARPHAHCYIFGDIDNFILLKQLMQAGGWNVFRTPLIWVNPQGSRAPWPEKGPQRKYQICLFAIKGDKMVNSLAPDVLTFSSDPQLNHPAQKPVALYTELLKRSTKPGETVLDPFGGTGTILPAAHELKCKAIYIERDASAYGTALKRLELLK